MTRVFSSLRTTAGRFAVNFALLALLALVMLVSMRFGSLKLTFAEIVGTLWNRPDGINGQIIFNIRLPRILLGALVGGSLAAAGTILQGVMRNPLASPGIIGVSAGGGLGGILVMLVLPQFGYLLVPAAFGGALVTAVLVYLLAWKRGVNPVRLILAGVAVSAMLGAFSSTILILNAEGGRRARFHDRFAFGPELAADRTGRAVYGGRFRRRADARAETQYPDPRR